MADSHQRSAQLLQCRAISSAWTCELACCRRSCTRQNCTAGAAWLLRMTCVTVHLCMAMMRVACLVQFYCTHVSSTKLRLERTSATVPTLQHTQLQLTSKKSSPDDAVRCDA